MTGQVLIRATFRLRIRFDHSSPESEHRGDGDAPGTYVDIPVAYAYALRDNKEEPPQEFGLLLDNTEIAQRSVNVVRVKAATTDGAVITLDDTVYVDAERPFVIAFVDRKEGTGSQEHGWLISNAEPPPFAPVIPQNAPEDFPGRISHFVRFTADNTIDCPTFVDLEFIDALGIIDFKAGTGGQEKLWLIVWPDPGDPINDQSDPYNQIDGVGPLTLGYCDPTLEQAPDSDIINPPYRLGPFQNIVNVSGVAAVEFETDAAPVVIDGKKVYQPYTGTELPGMAILHQAATTISDFGPFTCSVFFNLPLDGDSPVIGRFAEWGGNGTLNEASRLEIIDVEGQGPTILLRLIGPTRDITWGGASNFYGLVSWLPATMPCGSFVDVQCPLVPIYPDGSGGVSTTKFNNKWHTLQVSVANPGAAFTAPSIVHSWVWTVESGVDWSDATYTVALGTLLTTELGTMLGLAGLGAMVDPQNTSGSFILDLGDLDLSTSSLQDHMPDPVADAGTRIYVRFRPTNPSGYPPYAQNTYLGLMWTSMPTTALALTDTVAARLVLDGAPHLFDDGSGANLVRVNQFLWTSGTTVDGRSGFVINGSELAMPRFAGPPAAGSGRPIDKRRRHVKMQFWFGTFVDLNDSAKIARFVEVKPGPPGGPAFVVNPARFTQAEAAAAALAGTPLPVSPAALTFGNPHLYFDGGPSQPPPAALTGFPKNRGTAGAFTVINDIIGYTPGPSNIPRS